MASNEEVAIRISAKNEASAALRSAKSEVDGLTSATERHTTKQTAAAASTRQWGAAFSQAQTATRGFQSSLNQTVDRGLFGLTALTGAAVGFGLKTAISLEQSQVSFKTFLGSASAADEFVKSLQKFSANTPFTLPGLTNAAQQMLAFGFAAKDVLPTLTAVGDASAGLGRGQQGIDQITRALGQIKAKGRVQGDELLQLQEVGLNVRPYLSASTGLSGAALEKAITGGQVTADKAIPAIIKGIEKQFPGLMADMNKTLGGQLSNLQDTFTTTMSAALMPVLPSLTAALPKIGADVGAMIKDIAPKLPALVDALVALAPVAVEVAGAFIKVVTAATPMVTSFQKLTGGNGIPVLLGGLLGLRVLSAAGGVIETVTGLSKAFRGLAGAEAAAAAAGGAGAAGAGVGAVAAGTGAAAASRLGRLGGLVGSFAKFSFGSSSDATDPTSVEGQRQQAYLKSKGVGYVDANGKVVRPSVRGSQAVSRAPVVTTGERLARGDTFDVGGITVNNPTSNVDVELAVQRALQNTARQRRDRS